MEEKKRPATRKGEKGRKPDRSKLFDSVPAPGQPRPKSNLMEILALVNLTGTSAEVVAMDRAAGPPLTPREVQITGKNFTGFPHGSGEVIAALYSVNGEIASATAMPKSPRYFFDAPDPRNPRRLVGGIARPRRIQQRFHLSMDKDAAFLVFFHTQVQVGDRMKDREDGNPFAKSLLGKNGTVKFRITPLDGYRFPWSPAYGSFDPKNPPNIRYPVPGTDHRARFPRYKVLQERWGWKT
jgi:hypothetical protein